LDALDLAGLLVRQSIFGLILTHNGKQHFGSQVLLQIRQSPDFGNHFVEKFRTCSSLRLS